jgi:hypothetical protein
LIIAFTPHMDKKKLKLLDFTLLFQYHRANT